MVMVELGSLSKTSRYLSDLPKDKKDEKANSAKELVTISTKALDLLWSLAVLEGASESGHSSASQAVRRR